MDILADFELIFRQSPAPCMVLDHDLRFVTATDAYLATVARDLDELRGTLVFDAFPEDPAREALFRDAFQRALAGEENALVEVPFAIPEAGGKMREIWWTCTHRPIRDANGDVKYMVQNAQDVTEKVRTQQLKDAITAELQHRVGNILTLVSTIAKRTAGSSDTIDTFLTRFNGRISALAKTHAYLTGPNWDRMTIDKLVDRQLVDYFELESDQIRISGDPIALTASEAQTLSMAIHELTTNSIKHGALKSPQGRLSIAWERVGAAGYNLEWREDGLQNGATATQRSGFGTMILDSIVPSQLRGSAVRHLAHDHFLYQLHIPERAEPR